MCRPPKAKYHDFNHATHPSIVYAVVPSMRPPPVYQLKANYHCSCMVDVVVVSPELTKPNLRFPALNPPGARDSARMNKAKRTTFGSKKRITMTVWGPAPKWPRNRAMSGGSTHLTGLPKR